jgi:hypothetical protein
MRTSQRHVVDPHRGSDFSTVKLWEQQMSILNRIRTKTRLSVPSLAVFVALFGLGAAIAPGIASAEYTILPGTACHANGNQNYAYGDNAFQSSPFGGQVECPISSWLYSSGLSEVSVVVNDPSNQAAVTCCLRQTYYSGSSTTTTCKSSSTSGTGTQYLYMYPPAVGSYQSASVSCSLPSRTGSSVGKVYSIRVKSN